MLMVENFTLVNENTYSNEVNDVDTTVETCFEDNIRQGIKSFAREPHQKTIDNILNYSKSLKK